MAVTLAKATDSDPDLAQQRMNALHLRRLSHEVIRDGVRRNSPLALATAFRFGITL